MRLSDELFNNNQLIIGWEGYVICLNKSAEHQLHLHLQWQHILTTFCMSPTPPPPPCFTHHSKMHSDAHAMADTKWKINKRTGPEGSKHWKAVCLRAITKESQVLFIFRIKPGWIERIRLFKVLRHTMHTSWVCLRRNGEEGRGGGGSTVTACTVQMLSHVGHCLLTAMWVPAGMW